ncbi:MAG TPA: histidine kinase [Cyclobacteriaceae bacterium]|nr:histidine kinase [Cyclobacteriaceae bacterium]
MVDKLRLYWTLQVGGWLLYSLVNIGTSIAANGSISDKRTMFFFGEALLCLAVTHVFRVFLNRRQWHFMAVPGLIPRVLVSVGIMGVIVYFLRLPLSLALGFYEAIAFDLEQILLGTAYYALLFFLWSVFYFTYHYFERYSKSLKYEASVIQIELNNLRSQLNPHFIFNALNSIRALVDENPAKSKQAINQLSNILRRSLTSDKKGLTKFDDELKIVKDYLGLESIRFEERLRTEFDIHPESHNFLVPPLMIQTLVENGIKHGVSKLKEGGIIQLTTSVRNGSLSIQIRNSGQMVNGVKKSRSGLGIKNTVQRLKLIYGDRSTFRIANENNNFVLTEIIIPPNNAYESINR